MKQSLLVNKIKAKIGFFYSFAIHLLVFVLSYVFTIIITENGQIRGEDFAFVDFSQSVQDKLAKDIEPQMLKEENLKQTTESEQAGTRSDLAKGDTSNLKQIYSESTLNVKVKYPIGWTYLDQNVRGRLDGVTFYGVITNDEIPPYIHLEVQDKDIFLPQRYSKKMLMNKYELYYNDPEVLEDTYTQIVYIRTNESVDYQIKLIIKGKERFNQYLPVFFGMIKTFKN